LKLIAISTRVDEVSSYSETRDSLDQRWGSLLVDLGLVPCPIPNSLDETALQYLFEKVDFGGLLLTGGNDLSSVIGSSSTSAARDKIEKKLIEYCIQQRLPILGVCRGMQLLVEYFGGSIIEVPNHIATHHLVDVCEPIVASFETNSSHRYSPNVATLPDCLKVTATSHDGQIEALRHVLLPIKGIMWHPERNAEMQRYDINLLEGLFK
jgi:N5-(cytidine 5'-diphosphoramidyl)-L-glutamine hydrolase